MKSLFDILPVYGMEHDTILSKMGDITVAFKVELPELFTMSNDDYEAFHHSWIKAIKVLPINSVLYKQDWFTEAKYNAAFQNEDNSFLSRSSERFFKERPYLDHRCYIMLTKKPANRKAGSSIFSSLVWQLCVSGNCCYSFKSFLWCLKYDSLAFESVVIFDKIWLIER